MIDYIVFRHNGVSLLAAGEEEDQLPVYIRSSDRTKWKRYGGINWPSCMKFWDAEDIDIVQQGQATDTKELFQMLESGRATRWSW